MRYLKEIQNRYNITTAFYISERTRNYYHPSGIIKTLSESDPDDQWYFRTKEINEAYDINLDFDTADRSRLSIFINYRVTDYNSQFIGIAGIGLLVDRVARLIENHQLRYNSEIYFINRRVEVTVPESRPPPGS